MKSTIDMARESHLDVYGLGKDHAKFVDTLKAFEALVRADEREQGQKWFDTVTAQHKADIDRAFSAGLAEGEKLAIEAAAPYVAPQLVQGPVKPRCKVGGMPAPGHMCPMIIVGSKLCGEKGFCPHQEDTTPPNVATPLAAQPALKPFTSAQIERLYRNTAPAFRAESLAAFVRACRTVEAAHGIKENT